MNALFLAQLAALKASALALAAQAEALLQSVAAAEAEAAQAAESARIRCPRCGSPKHQRLSDDDEPLLLQCMDCYGKYGPENQRA